MFFIISALSATSVGSSVLVAQSVGAHDLADLCEYIQHSGEENALRDLDTVEAETGRRFEEPGISRSKGEVGRFIEPGGQTALVVTGADKGAGTKHAHQPLCADDSDELTEVQLSLEIQASLCLFVA